MYKAQQNDLLEPMFNEELLTQVIDSMDEITVERESLAAPGESSAEALARIKSKPAQSMMKKRNARTRGSQKKKIAYRVEFFFKPIQGGTN